MIYVDNAATTKLDSKAFEKMKPFLLEEYGNASQPYSFSRNARKVLKEARRTIANCINAEEEEIYFTSGGTESNNWAIKCFDVNCRNNQIITSKIEHHSVLNTCKVTTENLKFLNPDSNGVINPTELKELFEDNKNQKAKLENILVSVMLANNEIGTIQPIKELAELAHSYGACFHTDAVQAVGHIKIDVKELNVDMLSASAHKFNGPKGVGFLYIKKGTSLSQLIIGGSQEKGMRAGTQNVSAIVGMAVALKENCENIDANSKHITEVENAFIDKITENKLDFIRNGYINHLPGNVNISIRNGNGEMLLHRLDLMGICVSTGSACDNVNNQVSHVIKAIGVPSDYAEGTIRISFGKENTVEEAIFIADSIMKIV